MGAREHEQYERHKNIVPGCKILANHNGKNAFKLSSLDLCLENINSVDLISKSILKIQTNGNWDFEIDKQTQKQAENRSKTSAYGMRNPDLHFQSIFFTTQPHRLPVFSSPRIRKAGKTNTIIKSYRQAELEQITVSEIEQKEQHFVQVKKKKNPPSTKASACLIRLIF